MKFLKFILKLLFRIVEAIAVFLLLAGVLPSLLSIPGCNRFHRYCSYKSLQEMTAAETNDILKVVSFQQDGSNFTAVVVAPCRCLASGPAVLIYDQQGKLIDCNLDVGDYCYKSGRSQKGWNFSPWCSLPEAKLRKMRIPEIFPAAPATMGELAAFLQQATIDDGDPERPKEKRIVKFVCSDAAAKKVFPERPKPTEPLIESISGADVSIWDALLKCCRDTGCVAEVRVEGVVTIEVRPPVAK